MVAVRVPDAGRYGGLDLGDNQMLRGFSEKRPGVGLVNAGVYLLRDTTIARFPKGAPLSLEYDVFPALLAEGARIAVRPCDAPFLDIGTEASLGRADAFVREHMRWFE
jgi:D-glycero-alpha-D-manno-heptose 1-phosphate guanylyltransferase